MMHNLQAPVRSSVHSVTLLLDQTLYMFCVLCLFFMTIYRINFIRIVDNVTLASIHLKPFILQHVHVFM